MIGKKIWFEFFKISPTSSLVLDIDAPKFTIVDVNEPYLENTRSKREDLIGKGIFEAFPDNDSDPTADGVKNLSHSLQIVIATNSKHKMAIQKYDIPIRGTSGFELKYWEFENIPLFNDDGKLKFIIHCANDITEKVKEKKQAKEFEYFFINSNDFSCIANTEGYFEIANASFNTVLGYSQNELAKNPFIDFVHPDDVKITQEAYDRLKSGATVIHFINRYRKKDGSYIWLDWNATPNPATGKLYCIARDVTERKKAEDELSNLNEELENRVEQRTIEVEKALKENTIILESIGDAFFAVDKNWTVTYWNRIAERDLSVSKQDIVGKNLWEIFSDNVDSESYKRYHQALTTNEVVHFEDYYPVLNKWYEISAYPSENGLAVYFKDITESKKAKKLLEESNERFEYVTKATFDAVWDWNLKEDKIYWGEGFEKIFGYKLTKLKNDSGAWMQNIHPEDIKKITESYYAILKSEETNWIEEYRYKKSNGQYSYVINKGVVIRDIDGRVVRIIGAMQDITKKKEEESLLKLLESVITNTNDAVVIKEAFPSSKIGRKIVYVNKSFTRMSGYSPDEVIGKTHQLLQGPNTDKEELARFYKALDNLEPCEITIINYNKSGKEYWVNMSLNPVINSKGECTHWISIERDVTEKKGIEDELIKRLKEISDYKYALDESSIVAITNQKGIITYVNDNFCKISKYSREELLGQDHRIINSSYHPKEFIKDLWTTIANGKVWKGELKNKAKDGTPYWVDTTIVPFLNEDGKPYQYVAIRSDITERKAGEEELLKRLKEISDYKYALDESAIVAITNQKGIITHVNDNFCKISKYSREELLGQDHRIINSSYHPKEFINELWTTIAKGKVWKGELKNKAKDGTPYWVDTTIVPFLNEDGKPYQYVAIRSDITERKNQEQKTIEATQALLNTLESIQDGFYTLDSNWNITYWNKEAEKISGRTQEEMTGKNFWELYEGQLSEKIHKAFYKAKSEKKPIRIEVYSKTSRYWFELNAFPSEMGLTIYFKNITERKITESKLKKINRSLESHVKELAISNKELEQFAYVASHDLQEPLRMVTSFLSQIERKYNDVLDEKGKKYIFFAVDGAKRMRQIILDLLEFSRVGKNESKLEEVDFNEIVEEIKLLYRKQIEDKKAEIHYESLPIIKTHAAPIKQVFQNLISNGLKYSKSNELPVITVSCQETPLAWKFQIKDNGIGINQEYFEKVFVIFQRLHTKEEYSGTGMGLAIAKKIIENLRGQIWIESEEGKGTTFYFTIPKK